jgi:hypothetical protein
MRKCLMLLLAAMAANAATIVGVNGPVNFSGSIGANVQVITVGFTTGQAYNDVSFSAYISGPVVESYTAYLTTAIGPGTSVADEIASITGNLPGAGPGGLTSIFTGLNLAADTYYVTIYQTLTGGGSWSSTETPVTTALPGSSHAFSGYFITNGAPVVYAPASPFVDLEANSGRRLLYALETSAVPEPGTWLSGVGIVMIALAYRRRRAQ